MTNLNIVIFCSTRSYMETKGWDVFRVLPPEQDSSSEAMNKKCMAITVRVLKVIAYVGTLVLFQIPQCIYQIHNPLYSLSVSFCIVLGGAVISKTTILFMTSQIRPHKKILHCNKDLERDKQYVAEISSPEQVAWIWCIATAFLIPELGKSSFGRVLNSFKY